MGLGGDAKQTFRVSNLEDIKSPDAVKAEGLDASFPVFTNEIVSELAQRDAETRRILTRNGRRLRVVPIPGTSEVYDIKECDCPSSTLPG